MSITCIDSGGISRPENEYSFWPGHLLPTHQYENQRSKQTLPGMSWHRILEFLAHLSWFYQTYCSSVERRGPWASCLIKEQIRKHVTPSTKAKMFSFLSFISRMCINFYLIFKKTQNSDLWLSWLYNVFCQHYSCQKELEQACTNWDSLEQWYVLCAVLVLMSLNIIFCT